MAAASAAGARMRRRQLRSQDPAAPRRDTASVVGYTWGVIAKGREARANRRDGSGHKTSGERHSAERGKRRVGGAQQVRMGVDANELCGLHQRVEQRGDPAAPERLRAVMVLPADTRPRKVLSVPLLSPCGSTWGFVP
jgi:hypothetical protein